MRFFHCAPVALIRNDDGRFVFTQKLPCYFLAQRHITWTDESKRAHAVDLIPGRYSRGFLPVAIVRTHRTQNEPPLAPSLSATSHASAVSWPPTTGASPYATAQTPISRTRRDDHHDVARIRRHGSAGLRQTGRKPAGARRARRHPLPFCGAVPNGWRIVDAWRSQEDFDHFVDETLLPAARSLGIPAPGASTFMPTMRAWWPQAAERECPASTCGRSPRHDKKKSVFLNNSQDRRSIIHETSNFSSTRLIE